MFDYHWELEQRNKQSLYEFETILNKLQTTKNYDNKIEEDEDEIMIGKPK